MSATLLSPAIDTSDVPTVATRELAVALKLLSGAKGHVIPARALSEDNLRRVEQHFWHASKRDRTRKVAVLLRFRGLLEACQSRRLAVLIESRGEEALVAALDAAATMRLNAKWGFNPLKLARAVGEALSASTQGHMGLAAAA